MNRAPEILVVDDTPANLNVLRAMLEEDGYRVAVAPNGEIALRIAAKIRPALILLDVMMPGIDGYETCRRLKNNNDTVHIPVIFVTARTDSADIVEGFTAGGIDYIAKPFKREEVLARVRTQAQLHLSGQRLREEAERFRAIVNNISEALLMFDTGTLIRYANPAALHLLRQKEDVLLRADLSAIMQLQGEETYAGLISGENSALYGAREVVGRHGDGSQFAMDLSISPVFLQEPLFIAILRDISQQKSAEALLQAQANTDALTHLANRRHFDALFMRELGRAHRQSSPLAVMMLDIDHFKAFNDHYGHPQGDRAIIHVARILQSAVARPTDVVARYGGEEFVLLLPETEAAGALSIAKKIEDDLRLNPLLHEYSATVPHISVSIGIACIGVGTDGSNAMSTSQLLAAADSALYEAKHAGRNRSVCVQC